MNVSVPDLAILKYGTSALQALKIETITQHVEQILDIILLGQAKTGFRHLNDALSAETEAGRRAELDKARTCFAALCEVDAEKPLTEPRFRVFGFGLWRRKIRA
jgi:hypothetical protein